MNYLGGTIQMLQPSREGRNQPYVVFGGVEAIFLPGCNYHDTPEKHKHKCVVSGRQRSIMLLHQ
jgi:hypothetical protein